MPIQILAVDDDPVVCELIHEVLVSASALCSSLGCYLKRGSKRQQKGCSVAFSRNHPAQIKDKQIVEDYPRFLNTRADIILSGMKELYAGHNRMEVSAAAIPS